MLTWRITRHLSLLLVAIILAGLLCEVTEESTERALRQTASLLTHIGLRNPRGTVTIDSDGLPIVDYGTRSGVEIGRRRNPVTVAQKALTIYESVPTQVMLSASATARKAFLFHADWLVDNATPHQGFDLLEYRFPWPDYDLAPPWRSAMAQVQAIQVLDRACLITADSTYAGAADRLLQALFVPVDSGGVTYKDSEQRWWFEEYAGVGGRRPRVLNGMMLTLTGLHDHFTLTSSDTARILFGLGMSALAESLPTYDASGFSYYSALRKVASRSYHRVHIELLEELHRITGDPVLADWAGRWRRAAARPFVVRLLKQPERVGLAILMANAFPLWVMAELALAILIAARRRRLDS